MSDILLTLVVALVSGGAGIFAARFFAKDNSKKIEAEAQERAAEVVRNAQKEGENIKKDRIIEARENFLKLKTEFEEDSNRKKQAIVQNEQRIKQREQQITQTLEQNKRRETELETQKTSLAQHMDGALKRKEDYEKRKEELEKRKEEIEKIHENLHKEQVDKLEKIANLTAEQAREQMMEALKADAHAQASTHIKNIIDEAKLTATKDAKKIVIETIQRTAAEHAIENCVSVFSIESDDVKGKVIGREGRNIRALESATGCEIIVDDTPEAIVISGFDPVRREIARLSLHRLVQDGRIHPARIEEVVAKTKKNIEDEIIEIGERTVIELGVNGLHPELVKMVGRMRFRSSYGQNLLQHSREVARLCSNMAAEMGLNTKLAKRAGLLHDIGKVWPEESELPHALLGMELAKKYKEHPDICNAIGAHHDEIEMTTIISPIIQVCDAISGSRPGARREMMESYIKRLKDLEALAMNFSGVEKCYAIQAGRELRVIVDSDNLKDEQASKLSFDISQKIEKEMQYPGQIKVTVIREMRSVAYAK